MCVVQDMWLYHLSLLLFHQGVMQGNDHVVSGSGTRVDPRSTYVNPGSTYVDLEFQIHSVDPGFTYVDHRSHAWIPDIYYDQCVDLKFGLCGSGTAWIWDHSNISF